MLSDEASMKLLDGLLDLLFPGRCVFCRRLTQAGALVCPQCLGKLPYTGAAARQQFPRFDCFSPLYYTDAVRSSLLRYKFGGLNAYAKAYGDFLSKCIDENVISCDYITWTPLSKKRLRRRGYDQARLLAEELARRRNIPCVPMLRKIRDNRAQSSIGNAEKRRQNVKGVYEALPTVSIRGKHILLVDDIVTTGATLSACAAELKKAGAEQITCLTVARRKE